ncbi:nucleoside 2-deoxyribosyltransferase [Candidatus Saccharibacteria bacterium]|nr:nucleoside 2-deoxyribosyltransferase [Candidatus Saccharibacteria bacterium]
MKICICCSLSFSDEAFKIADELEKLGHEVLLPSGIINRSIEKPDFDAVAAKHDNGYDAMRGHFAKIRKADAILVCNFTKKGIENYIGANAFLEMGYAYSLKKPIYVLNRLPDQPFINDELKAFDAVELASHLDAIAIS